MSETTKTLQRWDCHHEYIEKVEGNEWGDWVSYDDAAKLLAENERLRAENDLLISAYLLLKKLSRDPDPESFDYVLGNRRLVDLETQIVALSKREDGR